jgi:protein Mpv17
MLYIFIGIIGGSTPKLILNKIKNDLFYTILGSWMIWPLAHKINFTWIPTKMRLMYINLVQLIYNIFLSTMTGWPTQMF